MAKSIKTSQPASGVHSPETHASRNVLFDRVTKINLRRKRVAGDNYKLSEPYRKFSTALTGDPVNADFASDVELLRQSLAWQVLDLSDVDLLLLNNVYQEFSSQKHTSKLTQFFLDVQGLAAGVERTQDQYKIYSDRINEFKKENQIFTQKQAYSVLKKPSESSPSRTINKLIGELRIFSVTYKSQGTTIGYPAFQFNVKSGRPKPIIKKVIKALKNKYQDWDLLFWFTSFSDELECTPLQAVDKPDLHEILLEVADNETVGYV